MIAARTQHRSRRRRSAGFSMVEILMAAMILAVGFIMLLPAFTVGLTQSRRSIESSMTLQLGQNAESYIKILMDTFTDGVGSPKDPNFSNANVDGSIHVYSFGQGGRSIVNEASVRVYGDPTISHYYWSALYRFPTGQRSLIELWIMVNKRLEATKEDPEIGLQNPVKLTISGNEGATSINAGGDAAFMDPGSGVVTNTGEILKIGKRNGSTLTLSEPVATTFSSVYIVKFGANGNFSDEDNACIGVFHTFVGF